MKSNVGWPFLTNKEYTEKFGKFTVTTSKQDSKNGYYVHGKSNDGEQFCIYFSKREDSEGSEISIVPNTFPNDPKNLSYCSYSSITESDKANLLNGVTNNNDSTEKELYSWGGFKSNAEYNDVIINGVLVTYGADPHSQPGSGEGLSEDACTDKDILNGGIKIENCENFKIIYTSSDINTFLKLCKEEKPIGLTKIYQNTLYH